MLALLHQTFAYLSNGNIEVSHSQECRNAWECVCLQTSRLSARHLIFIIICSKCSSCWFNFAKGKFLICQSKLRISIWMILYILRHIMHLIIWGSWGQESIQMSIRKMIFKMLLPYSNTKIEGENVLNFMRGIFKGVFWSHCNTLESLGTRIQ